MKQAIRRLTVLSVTLALIFLFAGTLSVNWASCGTSQLIANYSTGGQLNVPGTLDDGSGNGTIVTKFWIQGQSSLYNSGSLPTTRQVMPWNQSSYFIWSNWGNEGVKGECPSYNARNVFLYSIENHGKGSFILLSTAMDTKTTWSWDFDSVTNGNGSLGGNTEEPISIPAVKVDDVISSDNGTATVYLSWNPLDNLNGFYDQDPGKPLVTGYVIRYYQGINAPYSFRSDEWPMAYEICLTEKGTKVSEAKLDVPYTAGMKTYVALSLIFDGGRPGKDGSPAFTETTFVGAPAQLRPHQEPVAEFSGITALKTSRKTLKVVWTMDKQFGVKYYTVYAAHSKRKGFRNLANIESTSDLTYNTVIKTRRKRLVYIIATLDNGKEVKSPLTHVVKAVNYDDSYDSNEAPEIKAVSKPLPLPSVSFGIVSALRENKKLVITWTMDHESGVSGYTVLGRKANGEGQIKLGTCLPEKNNSNYLFTIKGHRKIDSVVVVARVYNKKSVKSRETSVKEIGNGHNKRRSSLSENNSKPLPLPSVSFGIVSALRENKKLVITWTMDHESGVSGYTVLGRKANGEGQIKLGTCLPEKNNSNYQFTIKGHRKIDSVVVVAQVYSKKSVKSSVAPVVNINIGRGGKDSAKI